MKMSMRSTPFAMKQAILHMIGQMEDMSQPVKTGDIARFLNVTKPTAQRYLRELFEHGSLACIKHTYRTNAKCFEWDLGIRARRNYVDGVFKMSYQKFIEQKWSM